jgi:hypothetical protein
MDKTSIKQKKMRLSKPFIIIISILITLSAWAALTKADYIPNFLGIQMLCSGKDQYQQTSDPLNLNDEWFKNAKIAKPVIYLYPEHKQDILVQLQYDGEIIADYPEYDNQFKGWKVTAYPDGTIINKLDNKEYSYIFWEGLPSNKIDWNLSTGFVVKGEDTREFLQEKLAEIGLTPREYNEFIVYWYPKMKDNEYNLIHFTGEEYTDTALLTINPEPDSMLRVFMVYRPLNETVQVLPQKIDTFQRKGFTVVEWGGTEIN